MIIQMNLGGRDIRKRGEQARLARAKRESALPIGPLRGGHSEGIGEALFSPSNILLVGVYHIRQKTASKAPG